MTCTTLLARAWPDPIKAGGKEQFVVDFLDKMLLRWPHRRLWEEGDQIAANGFDALCIAAGRSGESEPRWRDALGAEIKDGSAAWRMIDPTSDSLRTIAGSIVWSPPSGIAVSGQVDGTTRSSALLSIAADLLAGQYTFNVTAFCGNDEELIQPCILTVE